MEQSEAKRRARAEVRGVWIAITTPFTADGRALDEEALRRSVEYVVDDLRVDGIFCGGVMGEFWALTLPERKRVHELVVEQAAGRVPVMPHVGTHTMDDQVELAHHAERIGARFGIAINPYYPLPQHDDMVRGWYRELDARTSLPMFLFNTQYSGYSLSPELIGELADLDTICGIKNPGPRDHLLAVQRIAGDRLVVADASEEAWLELHLEHGLQALMSTPELALYQWPGHTPVADYTALADAGDLESAWKLHGTLDEVRTLAHRWIKSSYKARGIVPIAALKAWLGNMGLPQGPVRAPLVPLSDAEHAALRDDMEALGLCDVVG